MDSVAITPEQLDAVLEDHDLFDCAFSEMMRHSPPVLGQLRYSVNDVTFSGVTIPANQTSVYSTCISQ